MDVAARCPCGSGELYGSCCGPLHAGAAPAPTARVLMAARFSAFAAGEYDYLRETWHAATRPATLTPEPGMRWVRLEIVDAVAGGPFDKSGIVEFRAHYRTAGGGRGVLHERSRFVREDGRWWYVDGDVR